MNGPVRDDDLGEGGDAACWAHLVCAECGQVPEPGVPHRCGDDESGDEAIGHTAATN
jgi:hypothetical protein